MAKRKRAVHERTEDWAHLRPRLKWPEQVVYELIRPVVIFGDTPRANLAIHTLTHICTDRGKIV